jgi:hypothetical protein
MALKIRLFDFGLFCLETAVGTSRIFDAFKTQATDAASSLVNHLLNW